MKRKMSIILMLLLVMTIGIGCSSNNNEEISEEVEISETSGEEKPLKVALLLPGMLGDKSFLDSAANGMQTLEENGADVRIVEMGLDATKWVPTMIDISEQDYDVIVTGPWQVEDALLEVSGMFPDQKYLLFDTQYENGNPSNVCSILYKQNQISFLTGALAAKISESKMPLVENTGVIGFIGGMDIPVVNDFAINYIAGAQYVNPEIDVAVSYVGSFVDSAKGKELALSQYTNQKADIIFQCASQSGLGVLSATKELDKYAIGVDEDQSNIFSESDPEIAKRVLTSALKKVGDSIVVAIEQEQLEGLPWGGAVEYGLESNAIGFAKNSVYLETVPSDILEYMESLELKVKNNEIELTTAYGMETEAIEEIKNSVKPK